MDQDPNRYNNPSWGTYPTPFTFMFPDRFITLPHPASLKHRTRAALTWHASCTGTVLACLIHRSGDAGEAAFGIADGKWGSVRYNGGSMFHVKHWHASCMGGGSRRVSPGIVEANQQVSVVC